MLQDIISLDDEKIFKFICDFAECVSAPQISGIGLSINSTHFFVKQKLKHLKILKLKGLKSKKIFLSKAKFSL